MASSSVYHYEWALKWAYRPLAKADMAEDDRVNIERFADHLKARGVNDGRVAKYIFHLKVCATMIHLTGADRPDIYVHMNSDDLDRKLQAL